MALFCRLEDWMTKVLAYVWIPLDGEARWWCLCCIRDVLPPARVQARLVNGHAARC